MLKTNKTISISGTSEIEGVQVVYMSASISTDGGNVSISKAISNKELYDSNKVEVRKDMTDFEVEVYKVEDELMVEEVKTLSVKAGK